MFRNVPPVKLCNSAPVEELQKVSVDVERNGAHEIDVNFQLTDISDPEYVSSLPSYEDYSLEALLASGIPLDAIPVGTLLNPTNAATLERLGLSGSIKALELSLNDKGEIVSNLKSND